MFREECPPPPRMIHETQLAPLLEAAPSFAPTWNQYRADVEPEMVGHDFLLWLAGHLVAQARAGELAELRAVFTALEKIYLTGTEELMSAVTVGLLEDLMHIAEAKGVSLTSIECEITTPEVRRYWDAALAYTRSKAV